MKIGIIPGATLPFTEKLKLSHYPMANIAYLLSEELVKRGHEVFVFAPKDSKTKARLAPGFNFSSSFFKKAKTEKEKLKMLGLYYKNIISLSPQFDVLHLHEFIGSLRFLKTNLKCPLIVTLHAPHLLKRYKKLIKNKFLVAISKNQKGVNSHLAKFEEVVYNGIPIEIYEFNERPKDYLFFIGRICSEKGIFEAIKVAEMTKKKLLFAGPFPNLSEIPKKEKEYIKKVIERVKKKKYIKYLGIVEGKKKINYFKNAFCLLMPSKYEEPFGLVAIEAMACGTPVVGFNWGALPEVIKDGKTGFVVENLKEMAKAIEKIPQISRKKCREWVEKNFSVEKMAEGYEKIYKEVLRKWKGKI